MPSHYRAQSIERGSESLLRQCAQWMALPQTDMALAWQCSGQIEGTEATGAVLADPRKMFVMVASQGGSRGAPATRRPSRGVKPSVINLQRQYIDLRRDLKTSSALRAPSKVPVFLPGCQKLHVIADNYQLLILTAPVVVWFRRVCFCDSGAQGKFWAFCTRFLTPKRPKFLARAFGQAFGRHHSLSALDR